MNAECVELCTLFEILHTLIVYLIMYILGKKCVCFRNGYSILKICTLNTQNCLHF